MIDLQTRNKIAQIFVDMNVGDELPINKPDMIPVMKEVNDVAIIGHAMRFVSNNKGVIVSVKKYRPTAIEKRIERDV